MLPLLRCPASKQTLTAHAFTGDDRTMDCGFLLATDGKHWYPVVGGVAELLEPALWSERALELYERYRQQFDVLQLTWPQQALQPGAEVSAQVEQRDHFDHYADRPDQDYQAYQRTSFWKSVDAWLFERWSAQVAADALVLDIGCADGRSAFQWAGQQRRVLGFDISRRMVEEAHARAVREGLEGRMSFLVADGNVLPFAPDSFDVACTYGVLHHVPDPQRSLRLACGLIRPNGGRFYALENNASSLRFIFDWMMKVLPLWFELAGSEPLIGKRQFSDWLSGLPVSHLCLTSVYLPPHVFNLLPFRMARWLLRFSDGVSRILPWWREQGGLIVLEVERKA